MKKSFDLFIYFSEYSIFFGVFQYDADGGGGEGEGEPDHGLFARLPGE